jgi:homoserine kinase type II
MLLRIYNNGFNVARVVYEHALLRALADSPAAAALPFALPVLATTLPDKRTDGTAGGAGRVTDTWATLSGGQHACMFHLIEGGPAGLDAARSIGQTTAQLVRVLASIDPATLPPCPNPLYRNLFDAHHAMTRERFGQVMARPEFAEPSIAAPTRRLLEEVATGEALIDRLLALTPADPADARCGGGAEMPVQLIHADLHSDNVLAAGSSVTGVLDFEFAAADWRAMDVAVGLSKYLAAKGDIAAAVKAWVLGYASGGGELTDTECEAMAGLVKLRILSNVVYFAGRAHAGEDDLAALTSRVATYAARCNWLTENGPWLAAILREHVPRPVAA